MSKITPLSPNINRGWTLHITSRSGERREVEDVSFMELHNPKFGTVRYGQSADGPYDVWAAHDNGGAVTVPFAVIDGELYVGLVEQHRRLMADDPVLNVPRGFVKEGEELFETAMREAGEEVGLPLDHRRMDVIAGELVNAQSTFFETHEGNGIGFHSYRFSPEHLEQIDGENRYKLTAELKPKKGIGETFSACVFVPWSEALLLGCMFTRAIVGSLVGAEASEVIFD